MKTHLRKFEEFEGLYTVETTLTGNLIIKPHVDQIAYKIIDSLHVIIYKENMYVYNDGKYVKAPELVRAEATRIINGILIGDHSTGIKRNLADVMTNIENNNPELTYPFNKTKNAINVLNGVIVFDDDTGEFELVNHDPLKYVFDYILPLKYDECADSSKIMHEINKYSDKPDAIIQVLAQSLLQSMGYNPFKLAYLLYGPPNYGKSTIMKLFREFIGKGGYSGVALSRMSADSNNRFSLAALEGKKMNIKDELTYFKIADTETFKDVTGSYDITVEPKHIDSYEATSTAVHAFAANTTPAFDKRARDDDAFWRRWHLIACTKTEFPMKENFMDELCTEENMSGLLNEVLYMMYNYVTGGDLPHRHNVGNDWENVREEWLIAGNPLYKFITENMVRGGETALIKTELLEVVQEWCTGHILNQKASPDTVNGLIDVVKLCNGTIDERRNFVSGRTPLKPYEGIEPAEYAIRSHTMRLVSEHHTFVLPWTWKQGSKYEQYFTQTVEQG